MFTAEHFIWIAICTVLITGMSIWSVKKSFSFRTSALIMAGISLCSELAKVLSHMEAVDAEDITQGMVIEAGALPFHLCSIFILAFFYLPFAKNEKFKAFLLNLVVPVSFIGATLAILMATSGTDFAQPYAYQCFLYHAGMLWFSIYLVATGRVNLGRRAWLTNVLSLLALAFVMIWINGLLQAYDTNYFYVVRPPVEGLPLLNLEHGWYAYFAALLGCGLAGVSLVHLPFLIAETRAKKQLTEEK